MRKSILLFLLGLIAGLGLFINFEQVNIFLVVFLSFSLGFLFYVKNSKLVYFFLAMCLIFISARANFMGKSLRDHKPATLQFTVYEKRRVDDGYRYFLMASDKNIEEKTVAFMDQDLDIGDIFLAKAEFKAPATNTNPNLFSYRKYLSSKGIFSEAKIKKIEKKSKTNKLSLRLRNGFYTYVHRIFDFNMSKRSADFATSVVLGENLLEDDTLRDLGLSHILAVSGLHMDLLFSLVVFILRKFKVSYGKSYIISLLLAGLYGYLIAFLFSVIRVLAMNTISFLAFIYKKPLDKIKALMLVASSILIVNPFALLNAGFVLSFVASFSILLVYPRIKRKFARGYFGEIIAFIGSIQLGLLPFSSYYFASINLLSIPANFLIIPVFTIVMYIIFALLLIYSILGNFLGLVFRILDLLIASILNTVSVLGSMKIFRVDLIYSSLILSLYGFLLGVILLRLNKKVIKEKAHILLISALILSFSLARDMDKIHYQMIDIGQGDCFLIKDRKDYYLIDVGGPKYKGYDSGEKILIPYLKSQGIKKIEAVFISHEDKDHMGNIDQLVNNFDVSNIYTSKLNQNSLRKYKAKTLKKNERINLSKGYIECIYEGAEGEENANSMGLLINIRGVKILSLGDLPSNYEKDIDQGADILKLSHHGSKTSSDRDFIQRVDPKIVLISAGRNNTYGHPHKEVLDNVADRIIYNTQTDGLVEIDFTKNFKINPYLKGGYFR